MTFDLCVPAYNEAAIIIEALTRIQKALDNNETIRWRILLSDNASTDGTGDLARSLDPRIVVLRTEQKGKGAAILEAAHKSTVDFFGFIDADLSAEPSDIRPLLGIVVRNEADVVVGSRFLDARLVHRGFLRSMSSRIFNWFRLVLLGIKVSDSQCGLKVMNAAGRGILSSCLETGWFLDLEFLAKAERAGLRIREVPIHWNEQQFAGRASKLFMVRDGFGALGAMLRIRTRLNSPAGRVI